MIPMAARGSIVVVAVGIFIVSSAARAETRQEAQIKAAIAWAEPVLGKSCDFSRLKTGDFAGSGYFEINFRYSGQGQDEPDNIYPLVQLFCHAGTYTTSFAYLTKDPTTEDFKLLAFAEPKLDYDYSDETFTRLKAPPRIVGYLARTELINSEFDPATKTISMSAKWRRQGDAWSSGIWEFVEGEFVLKRYDVDPSYEPSGDNAQNADPKEFESYKIYPETK